MTRHSDLVKELERALTDEAYDGGMGSLSEDQFSELVRTLARTSAAVFEEAHIPTHERGMSEHLRLNQDQAARLCGCISCRAWLADSAHRSVGTEPGASAVSPLPTSFDDLDEARDGEQHHRRNGEPECASHHAGQDQNCTEDGVEAAERQDNPSHCRVHLALSHTSTLADRFRAVEPLVSNPEPQGEPTDAQLQAAVEAFTFAPFADKNDGVLAPIRAALRAAFAVTEQGEAE